MRIARFGPWRPPTGWQGLVERGLRAILAEANPDLDPAYERVTYWWLEVGDGGRVTREIGFDPSGRAVVAAPLGNNPGIFTDADHAPDGLGESVSVTQFERAWSELSSRFVAGDPG
jgi:hypothetical protein